MLPTGLSRQQIAWRAAQDIPDGYYVNLGIGIPTLVAAHLPADREIVFHSENGILGIGPPPERGQEDPDLINATKDPITLLKGGSFVVHSDAFAMIRGGHLDLALLGAFEVSGCGDLANWTTDDPALMPGVGGAMDLAVGARRVWVLMDHYTRVGEPRIRHHCSYPLTASGVVQRIYTNLAVIDFDGSKMVVRESLEALDRSVLQDLTEPPLRFAADWRPLHAPRLGS